ncbi:MAG: hypothetical protein K6T86_20960 [Pirellulales bacterium]|nr:hypothetical protein [Pirellulales bacterium]
MKAQVVAAMLLAVILGLDGAPPAAKGEDFRIATRLYSGEDGEESQIGETLTLFRDGTVYDFVLDRPRAVTIFEPEARRIFVLEPSRRLKVRVEHDELLHFVEQLNGQASRSSQPFLRFLARPGFEQQYDESSGRLSLRSEWLEYRVQTQPLPSETAAAQYREFADTYARLNAYLNVGALPPGGRLALNEALAELRLMPRQVELVRLRVEENEPLHRLRAVHEVEWSLKASDDRLIEQAREQLERYRLATIEEYRGSSG